MFGSFIFSFFEVSYIIEKRIVGCTICQALLESKGEGLFPPTVPGGKSKKYFSQLKAKSLAGFLQK